MKDNQEVKPLFKAVALDWTKYYNINEDDKQHIEKILDVFMYDSNTRTFCCSSTPTYFMEPIYTTIVFKDGVDSDKRDELDNRYCHDVTDSFYMNCSEVDAIDDQVASVAETADEASDEWRSNCPF